VAFSAGAIRTVTNCAKSNDADYRKKNPPSHIRGLLDTKNTGIDRLTRLSDESMEAREDRTGILGGVEPAGRCGHPVAGSRQPLVR
jgi:hypothetical protein